MVLGATSYHLYAVLRELGRLSSPKMHQRRRVTTGKSRIPIPKISRLEATTVLMPVTKGATTMSRDLVPRPLQIRDCGATRPQSNSLQVRLLK